MRMSIRSFVLAAAALLVAGCGRGVIRVATTLPRPAEGGSGVIVNVPEGTSVCERLQIHVYQGAPPTNVRAFPSDRKPIVAAGGFGAYSKESPQCTMVAHVEPGSDYWVLIALPESSYSTGGWPSLPGAGSHPRSWRAGAHPVAAVPDKATSLELSLTPYP